MGCVWKLGCYWEKRGARGALCEEALGVPGRAQPETRGRGQVPPGLTCAVRSAGFFITAWRKLLST